MASPYTITSIRQTSEIGPTGSLVDVVEATFEVAGGVGAGTVRVPKTAGWDVALQTAIADEAAAMIALLG